MRLETGDVDSYWFAISSLCQQRMPDFGGRLDILWTLLISGLDKLYEFVWHFGEILNH